MAEEEIVEQIEEEKGAAEAKANADAEAALKAVNPKERATHPPVLASSGQACQVEGCGFIFGDLVNGIEPHPTILITTKPLPKVEPSRPTPPAPRPSTAKCEPIGAQNTCPTCNWSAATSTEPHPVL